MNIVHARVALPRSSRAPSFIVSCRTTYKHTDKKDADTMPEKSPKKVPMQQRRFSTSTSYTTIKYQKQLNRRAERYGKKRHTTSYTKKISTDLVLVLRHVQSLLLPVLHECLADGVHLSRLRGIRQSLQGVVEGSLLQPLVSGHLAQRNVGSRGYIP